ncbi:hypothetical protein J1605_017496 [Eschrichtius robustus]|uniref:Uncharacterized protein n=1 Tax=Eschrichtius robustus TaxID=9764 RepID=A0AB34HYQ8_ESCRO|nr:hypothetical protein J1605_017496 [Eschrichtius robustus]
MIRTPSMRQEERYLATLGRVLNRQVHVASAEISDGPTRPLLLGIPHIQSSKSDLLVHLITLTSLRSCLAAPGKSLIRAVVKGVVRQMGQDGVTSSKRMMQTPENSGGETSVRDGILAGGSLDEVGAQSLGTDADSGGGEGQEDRSLCNSLRARGLLRGQPPSLAGAEGLGRRGALGLRRDPPDVPEEAAKSALPDLLSQWTVPSGASNPSCQSAARCIPLATCQLSSSAPDPRASL